MIYTFIVIFVVHHHPSVLIKKLKYSERYYLSQTDLLEKLKREEEEQLCIMAEPLRHYLVKYIFPTLTQGLVEVARLRPDDPIDFLVSTQLLLFLSPFRR